MDRLTKREKVKLSDGKEIVICNHAELDCNDSCMSINPCKWYKKVQEKLKAYEDVEEQGLLLRLPCKVGDTVWLANKLFSSEVKCLTIRWIEIVKGIGFHAELENGSGILFYDYEIGKTVFLTKEEAEKKLAEMKGKRA